MHSDWRADILSLEKHLDVGWAVKEVHFFSVVINRKYNIINYNKMLSYRRETALQGALVLAKSERLELGDNILRTL